MKTLQLNSCPIFHCTLNRICENRESSSIPSDTCLPSHVFHHLGKICACLFRSFNTSSLLSPFCAIEPLHSACIFPFDTFLPSFPFSFCLSSGAVPKSPHLPFYLLYHEALLLIHYPFRSGSSFPIADVTHSLPFSSLNKCDCNQSISVYSFFMKYY